MRITNLRWGILLSGVVLILSACSSNASITPLSTRAATQTPWIIERVVTATPEPPTVTPLPTATESKPRTPTKAPTAKPAATAIKPTVVPVVAPSPTAVPACNRGTVTPFFPENGVRREINIEGSSGPAFEFKWNTPLGSGPQDATIGYRIDISSRRGNQTVGGDAVYVSHNKYIEKGVYAYEGPKVRRLGAGDSATVTWQVTIIMMATGFNDQGTKTGTETNCGSPSSPMTIDLYFK